jgi:hypothetical protein
VGARPAALDYVRIAFRVDESLPWTEPDRVASDSPQELLFVDVQPGPFFYRATVVDVEGTEGAPAETSAFLAFDPPGTVQNFKATDE